MYAIVRTAVYVLYRVYCMTNRLSSSLRIQTWPLRHWPWDGRVGPKPWYTHLQWVTRFKRKAAIFGETGFKSGQIRLARLVTLIIPTPKTIRRRMLEMPTRYTKTLYDRYLIRDKRGTEIRAVTLACFEGLLNPIPH